MTVHKFQLYYELLEWARSQNRLMYEVKPDRLIVNCESPFLQELGECAVSIGRDEEQPFDRESCWVYNMDHKWGYLGGDHYVFDNEEDAVLMRLLYCA